VATPSGSFVDCHHRGHSPRIWKQPHPCSPCSSGQADRHLRCSQEPGFVKAFAVGSYASRGRVILKDSESMWAFMRKMKGLKLTSDLADPSREKDADGKGKLWHTIDKYPEEIELQQRTSMARKVLIQALLSSGLPQMDQATAEKCVDGRSDSGLVVLVARHFPGFGSVELCVFLRRKHVFSHEKNLCFLMRKKQMCVVLMRLCFSHEKTHNAIVLCFS